MISTKGIEVVFRNFNLMHFRCILLKLFAKRTNQNQAPVIKIEWRKKTLLITKLRVIVTNSQRPVTALANISRKIICEPREQICKNYCRKKSLFSPAAPLFLSRCCGRASAPPMITTKRTAVTETTTTSVLERSAMFMFSILETRMCIQARRANVYFAICVSVREKKFRANKAWRECL